MDYYSMSLQPSVNKDIPYFNTRMSKERSTAYRKLKAGVRYHQGEKLSHVVIGFRRGFAVDDRIVMQKFTQWVKRQKGVRVDYSRVRVTENASPDAKYRVHIHMIWNAPYLKQMALVEQLQIYAGDSVHVDIRLIKDNAKAVSYLMQYMTDSQEGSLSFTSSRNWLPKGYEHAWKDVKHDFYQKVKTYPKSPLNSDKQVLQEISLRDPEWRKAGLYGVMDTWIDEQRDKSKNYGQSQIDGNGEIFYVGKNKI